MSIHSDSLKSKKGSTIMEIWSKCGTKLSIWKI